MVALVLYAFATGVRSSRAIERHCRQDVAYRVVTGNLVPDHATVARFIDRHQRALAGLFGEVLRLCDRAGLVRPGVVSIDGTRIAGNCSPELNLSSSSPAGGAPPPREEGELPAQHELGDVHRAVVEAGQPAGDRDGAVEG
jgi:Transposase domain (DUF772)